MKPKFIGIAGGTGAGKSTLSRALKDKYPDKIEIIQLDDYFKPSELIPKLAGFDNWDHPQALYFDRLLKDINTFSQGKAATILTKNELINPGVYETQERVSMIVEPAPIMIVEGYLSLYDQAVRDCFSKKIFLDLSHDIRWKRRVHFKFGDYEKKVVKPMYEKYVAPTKKFADNVIDVSTLDKDEVLKFAEEIIFNSGI